MQLQDRNPATTPQTQLTTRTATVSRTTGETDVQVAINIDGTGQCDAQTGVPFLDHMLHQIASHGLFDLTVHAKGDYEIDDHHTNEDVGITLGMALKQALGDRKGIVRFGHFVAPLDEALVQVALDFSGRPHLSYARACHQIGLSTAYNQAFQSI
jgi:imidazoleglycerol-phosphate dehydratase